MGWGGSGVLLYSIPFFRLPAPFLFPGPGRVEQLDRLRGRWIPALPPVSTCCVTLGLPSLGLRIPLHLEVGVSDLKVSQLLAEVVITYSP